MLVILNAYIFAENTEYPYDIEAYEAYSAGSMSFKEYDKTSLMTDSG